MRDPVNRPGRRVRDYLGFGRKAELATASKTKVWALPQSMLHRSSRWRWYLALQAGSASPARPDLTMAPRRFLAFVVIAVLPPITGIAYKSGFVLWPPGGP